MHRKTSCFREKKKTNILPDIFISLYITNHKLFSSSNSTSCSLSADDCQNYISLTKADRKDTYESQQPYLSDGTLATGWYRFEGAAGTMMSNSCVRKGRCGGGFPGWLQGNLPTVAEREKRLKVCFSNNDGHGNSHCCFKETLIDVKNCISHFLYRLTRTTGGDQRYCGTDLS